MAERLSALVHLPSASPTNARVRLSETRRGSILQIQAWPETGEAVRDAIADLTGVKAPAIGKASEGFGVTIAAVAPGRYLVSGETEDLAQRFEAALLSSDGAVSDISHGRVTMKLAGEAAAAVLSTSVGLDLDLAVFPQGRVAQTMIHHIDVVIHRRSETEFELWVLRSFAESLAEWLLDQGAEFGINFRTS